MKVLRGSWEGWETEPTAVAIGVFDGVHRGHRAVLEHVMKDGLVPAVLTFDPHPVSIVAPEHAPLILTPLQRKLELFEQAGVEVVAVVSFNDDVRAMTPEVFCAEVLVGGMSAARVVVGADFHFGKDRAGTPEVLSEIGGALGFDVVITPLVGDGDIISSSAVRSALAEGRIEDAAAWLGRPFRVTAPVAEGERRGTTIGFPTANLFVSPGLARPGRGVYAVTAHIGGEAHPAVANVGVRPTFGGDAAEVVEVHVLDFDEDLYGTEISVDFVARIRDEQRFSGVDELVAQIGIDVEKARSIHAS